MKSLLLTLIFSSQVFAADYIIGGFGTDGATLEPIPNEQSVIDAVEVFKALAHLQIEPKEDIVLGHTVSEMETSSIECEEPNQGVHTLTAGCNLILGSGERSYDSETMTATFSGEFAKILYNALEVELDTSRVGASSKSIANITCTQTMSADLTTTCVVKNMFAAVMEL